MANLSSYQLYRLIYIYIIMFTNLKLVIRIIIICIKYKKKKKIDIWPRVLYKVNNKYCSTRRFLRGVPNYRSE